MASLTQIFLVLVAKILICAKVHVNCATFPTIVNNGIGDLLEFGSTSENSTVDYVFKTTLDFESANDNVSLQPLLPTPPTKRIQFETPRKTVLVGYITGSKRKPGDQVYATPGLRISGALTLALARINNDSRLLPEYKLVPLIGETHGDETESISEVARLWRSNVSVVIGPQETCVHEGRFAAAVDLPLFSYYCRMPEASDKLLSPTFVRTVPPISQISVALISLLKHFGWQHIALLHPRHTPLQVQTADKLLHILHDYNITITGVYSWQELFYVHAFFSTASESPFHHIVEQSFRTTRVYVILMKEKDDALALVDELQERQLLKTNEYAVIGIMMKQYDAEHPSSLLQGVFESSQPLKPSRLEALNYYLLIAPSPSRKHEYDRFQRDVAEYSSKPPFNYTTALNIVGIGRVQAKARPEAMYLYDAVNIYAHALNQCLSDVDATVESIRRMRFDDDDEFTTVGSDEETRNRDAIEQATHECLHSGRRIVQFILNRPYMSANGLGGMIDSHGDAQGNYTLLRLRKLNDQHIKTSWGIVPAGVFQSRNIVTVDSIGGMVVHPTSNLPTLHLFDEILWPGGNVPLSEPLCGFHGERCRPDVAKLIALYGGLLASCIIIALISGLCYRHFKYEKELSSFVWRIDRDDLLFNDETTNQLWQYQQQQQQMLVVQKSPLGGSPTLKPVVYTNHPSALSSEECNGEIPIASPTKSNNPAVMRLRNKISSISQPSQKERKRSTFAHPLFSGRFHAKNSDCRRSSLTRRDEAKVSLPTINSDRSEVALFKSSTTVVVKPLGNAVSTIEVTRELCKDMMMLKDMHCPNLTLLVGVCPAPAAVVWEYCQRGSLRDVLADVDVKIDKLFLASFTFDIIAGMQYIHTSSLKSHGNLRPTNILVDSKWVLKITDYGIERIQSQLKTQRHSSTVTQHIREKVLEKFIYVAPEILRERRRTVSGTQKGDIYSFAFVLYELFVRKTAMEMIRRTNILLSPEDIIQQIKSTSAASNTGSGGHKSQRNTSNAKPSIRPPMVATTVVVVADVAKAEAAAAAPVEADHTTTLTPSIPDFVSSTIQACWDDDPELRPEFHEIQTRLKPLRKGMKSDNIIDNVMALLERYATNLEDVVTERTKELESEKRRTETLLYEMLPRPVAEQLIHKKYVEAEAFEQVTVYFSDIIQFTNLCAKLTPMDVVTFLNDLYTLFDVVLELYEVYKVETIGDAYMVVSGAPTRNGDMHAAEIASMALHLIDVLQLFKVRPRPEEKCRIRVGIHSGPCAAGVVGRITPRYTLFGDTINTASRYESSSEAMRIHCSLSCQKILDKIGGYTLENRGLIEMKGKGAMQSFWVIGESNERSVRRCAFFSNANLSSNEYDDRQALGRKANNRHEKVKAALLLGRSPSIKSLLIHHPQPPPTTASTNNSLHLPSKISLDTLSSNFNAVNDESAAAGPIFRKFSYRQQQQHAPVHHSTSWGSQSSSSHTIIVNDKPTSASLGDDAFNFEQVQHNKNTSQSCRSAHKNSSAFYTMPFPPPSSCDMTSSTYRPSRFAYDSTITDSTTAVGSSSCKSSVVSSATTASTIELALMMFDQQRSVERGSLPNCNSGSAYVRRHSSGLPLQQQHQKHSLNISGSESVGLLMPMIREEERSNSLISSVSSRDNVPCIVTAANDFSNGKDDSKCG